MVPSSWIQSAPTSSGMIQALRLQALSLQEELVNFNNIHGTYLEEYYFSYETGQGYYSICHLALT
jgi:hypothetical protein